MSKLDFIKSLSSHKQLSKKHYDDMHNGNDHAWIKGSYHSSVAKMMQEKKRKLTKQEKEKLYKSAKFYFYN